MDKQYNLYNLEASFKEYLLAGNRRPRTDEQSKSGTGEINQLMPVSIKNYLSDFRHFAGWLIFVIASKAKQSQKEIASSPSASRDDITFITADTIEKYKSYLTENNIPPKTINRRLSTVRKFCSFCISQGWMKENAGKKISNISSLSLRGSETTEAISKRDRFANARDDILQQFKQDLIKENLDKSTINSYLNDVQEFLSI